MQKNEHTTSNDCILFMIIFLVVLRKLVVDFLVFILIEITSIFQSASKHYTIGLQGTFLGGVNLMFFYIILSVFLSLILKNVSIKKGNQL